MISAMKAEAKEHGVKTQPDFTRYMISATEMKAEIVIKFDGKALRIGNMIRMKTLQEIDEYIVWKKDYLERNPGNRQAPNIYKYRKMNSYPIYIDNEHFTCATMALNTMCVLLNINFSFNRTTINKFNGNQGFRYSKLCQMIQYQQKLIKTDFLFIEGIKNNYIKGC